MTTYEVLPLKATPRRAQIVSQTLREIARHETVFSAYAAECVSERDEACQDVALEEMCVRCRERMRTISTALTKPDARVWEVWRHEEAEGSSLVGIVHFSRVRVGVDAIGHYIFFDHDLQSKTGVLKEIVGWAFGDHPSSGWSALRRLTIEIPSHAFILARHASRRLGFGGPFEAEVGGKTIEVEGVKRDAVAWRDGTSDLLILGVTREEWMRTSEPEVEAAGVEPASEHEEALVS